MSLSQQERIAWLRLIRSENIGPISFRQLLQRFGSAQAAMEGLPALAHAGKFKEDLLDRLSFEVLHLPALRDRHGDIPLLAAHYAARMADELGLEPGIRATGVVKSTQVVVEVDER